MSNSSRNHSESFLSPLNVFRWSPCRLSPSYSSHMVVKSAHIMGALLSPLSSVFVMNIAAAGGPSSGTSPWHSSIFFITPVGPSLVRGFDPCSVGTWCIPLVKMLMSFPFSFEVLGSKSAAGWSSSLMSLGDRSFLIWGLLNAGLEYGLGGCEGRWGCLYSRWCGSLMLQNPKPRMLFQGILFERFVQYWVLSWNSRRYQALLINSMCRTRFGVVVAS